ncbi:DUF4440 domain-containing protein [Candidatus Nitrosocosmicus sp. T]
MELESEIREIVNRETEAWNHKDVEKLLSIFHPDMVWPWPRTPKSHDPVEWVMELGRFNYQRWSNIYSELFGNHELIQNNRIIQKIAISNEGDGAFAVVDIDTLWKNINTDEDFHWKGRVCKIYTKINDKEWKLIAHTGVLDYDNIIQ